MTKKRKMENKMKNDNSLLIVILILLILFLFGGFSFGVMGFPFLGMGSMMNLFFPGFSFMFIFMLLIPILVITSLVLFIIWIVRQLNEKPINSRKRK